VVFGEQHLNHIVHQFAEHDNTERPQRVTEGDAAGGVRPLAHRKVVRAGQAANRLRGLRGTHLHEPDPALAVQPTGDVVTGRADASASGGKIRGSRWSRSRAWSTRWCGNAGTRPAARGLNKSSGRTTGNDATTPAKEADVAPSNRTLHSAVVIQRMPPVDGRSAVTTNRAACALPDRLPITMRRPP